MAFTTIQLKRACAAKWAELNLVLNAGEPGFVTDEKRFKVGDGVTTWNDLPYIGEDSVCNCSTHYDFPSIGRVNVIYKAESEKTIYQWNPTALKYEVLNTSSFEGVLDITQINGGNANGNS